MKRFIACGLLVWLVACGEKDAQQDAEQTALNYAKDMLAGNIAQIAKNAKMPNGQALSQEQIEVFIQDRQYASKEYRVLSKDSSGIKAISVYDSECAQKMPKENDICVIYLDLLFNDSAGIPMAVPLVQVDKKWYPVFDIAYP